MIQSPAPSKPPPVVSVGFATEGSIPIPLTVETLLIIPSLSATAIVAWALVASVVVVVGAVKAIAKSVNLTSQPYTLNISLSP